MKTTEKRNQSVAQIDEMLAKVKRSLIEKLDQAIKSGSVPEEYMESDNYLLAKAVFDSWCRERQFSGLNKRTREEFDNIHTCC